MILDLLLMIWYARKGEIINTPAQYIFEASFVLGCLELYFISPVSMGNAVESGVKAMSSRFLVAHPRFSRRQRLCDLLSREADRTCIDEVSTADALRAKLQSTTFDLVIAHHSLVPDITILPGSHAVLLVTQLDEAVFHATCEHGILAYLSDYASEALLLATLDLKPGDFLIDPTFALRKEVTRGLEQLLLLASLTEQERKIVAFQQHGYSLLEIAEELCIEISTVKRHLANISKKRKQ
jgi:DNA-binding NarL/FixJ family response regulator